MSDRKLGIALPVCAQCALQLRRKALRPGARLVDQIGDHNSWFCALCRQWKDYPGDQVWWFDFEAVRGRRVHRTYGSDQVHWHYLSDGQLWTQVA